LRAHLGLGDDGVTDRRPDKPRLTRLSDPRDDPGDRQAFARDFDFGDSAFY